MTDDEPKAVAQNQRGELRLCDVAPALTVGGGKPGEGYAAVLVPYVKAKRASDVNDDETWKEGEVAPTLNAFDNGGDSRATVVTVEAAGGDLPPEGVLAFGWQEDRLAGTVYEDEVPGLTTSKTYAVARADEEGGSLAVRRLTPTECERLMGWPDGWTAVGVDEDGAEVVMADSSRYRQCGNGVASPVAEWVGRCIVAAEQELDA